MPASEQRDELILKNRRLVGYVAGKFPNALYYGHTWDDLVSIGMIGLVKAANAFKPESGNKFATFAIRCIENEILMQLRRKQPFTVSFDAVASQDIEKGSRDLTIGEILSNEADFSGGGVAEFIQQLPDREREILRMRMQGIGQKVIARRFKLSQSYVCRILKQIGQQYLAM